MNIRQIRKRLPFWVDVLNVPEWRINVRWGSKTEMTDSVGLNYYSAEEMISNILLAKDQSDYELEHTLVHELLHLVYDGHKPPHGMKYDPMHERGINRTTTALLKLAGVIENNNAPQSSTD